MTGKRFYVAVVVCIAAIGSSAMMSRTARAQTWGSVSYDTEENAFSSSGDGGYASGDGGSSSSASDSASPGSYGVSSTEDSDCTITFDFTGTAGYANYQAEVHANLSGSASGSTGVESGAYSCLGGLANAWARGEANAYETSASYPVFGDESQASMFIEAAPDDGSFQIVVEEYCQESVDDDPGTGSGSAEADCDLSCGTPIPVM